MTNCLSDNFPRDAKITIMFPRTKDFIVPPGKSLEEHCKDGTRVSFLIWFTSSSNISKVSSSQSSLELAAIFQQRQHDVNKNNKHNGSCKEFDQSEWEFSGYSLKKYFRWFSQIKDTDYVCSQASDLLLHFIKRNLMGPA